MENYAALKVYHCSSKLATIYFMCVRVKGRARDMYNKNKRVCVCVCRTYDECHVATQKMKVEFLGEAGGSLFLNAATTTNTTTTCLHNNDTRFVSPRNQFLFSHKTNHVNRFMSRMRIFNLHSAENATSLRRGSVHFAQKNKTIQTPACLTYTLRGSVPHLVADNLKQLPVESVQVSLDHL